MELKKIILIICDGLSDRKVSVLGNKTPLEYANTPNFDKIAETGITGTMDVLKPGSPPGSDAGHLAIFGYDIDKYYPNRGPIEALGSGIVLKEGALASRFNLATVEESFEDGNRILVIRDRRAGRISDDDARILVEYLQEEIRELDRVNVKIIHNSEHRGFLFLEGSGLSGNITDSDPHEVDVCVNRAQPLHGIEDLEAAERTAKLINLIVKKSYFLLKEHEINIKRINDGLKPANILLPRGAGIIRKVPSFSEKWGLKAACIAKLFLYRGVARYVGMDIYDAVGDTGNVDTDVISLFKKAVKLMNDYDFIFVHIKGTDSASHDKKPLDKVKFIEKIDKALSVIIDQVIKPERGVVVITSDHSTSSELGIHVGDPPAIVINAPSIVTDDVKEFNEKAVLNGGLGRISANDLMCLLLNYSSRALEYGLKPSPDKRIYRSNKFTPLIL
ncbi:MAG: 2,3-bisphosphoglycerate-independent phosphoglycerate mutase [Candidatus Odinarchaeia archaeon]